ncbi:hypothetical protein Cgig2_004198 [Carnegiea gigantea]|uniref:non-reducing end alpha-L-arabinofuranosidase n=1 Tax=Carnegiea gigantea TaxID=171969 RepID=A0A9Q1QND6_9CARY|nr:hypothetical protein Cgig2_004198 [Carnegiea gigantea]
MEVVAEASASSLFFYPYRLFLQVIDFFFEDPSLVAFAVGLKSIMTWSNPTFHHLVLWFLLGAVIFSQACIADHHHNVTRHEEEIRKATLYVDASSTRPIPKNFFGIFFEEINHAGTGGLWAELVSDRGFEAGGHHEPSMISPWGMIGDETVISVTTEMSSCFKTNPIALRMDIHCSPTTCPPGGVGVYNPGYWGMNVEEGKTYKIVLYIRSSGPLDAVVSFVTSDGTDMLAFSHITIMTIFLYLGGRVTNCRAEAEKVKNWTRLEVRLQATGSNPNCRLQFTTRQTGTIWLDQVSAMPTDTYKGHGFRIDLMEMLLNLKPRFLRFPGGCYVEGNWLSNGFRWKETVGPWEERPGHLGDVWNYWSDDGLGYLEYLQLAEDLGAEPVWVINSGEGHVDQVDTALIGPFVQEMLDSIEFARGSPNSTWGSLRAKLGHPKPFNLKYIAIGNENCGFRTYRGNYLKFYKALKKSYPDIKAISNCDGSKQPLDHPADLYDYHNYTSAEGMLDNTRLFEKASRSNPKAPKAFVSEYAVTDPKEKVGNGTFGGALAEAAFLLSLERNRHALDVVEMVSYAPLFVNENDRKWSPDAIVFNSHQAYGISSYWVQTFFKESSGALLLKSHLKTQTRTRSKTPHVHASAISWLDHQEKKNCITIKVVNYQNTTIELNMSFKGVDLKSIHLTKQTILTTDDCQDENTFENPTKVVPQTSSIKAKVEGKEIKVELKPRSFTAFDLLNKAHNQKIFQGPKDKLRG